jgi:cyclase
MLKKRVIANIVVKNGIVVQSINFKKYLPVGRPDIAIDFFNQWGIDEIIYTDISSTKNSKEPDYDLVKKISKKCFVPLTVSGGISNVDQIKKLMFCGADKIALNHQALTNSSLITKSANIFGNQCVVVSIDAIKDDSKYYVYDYINKRKTEILVYDFSKFVEEKGAGEILINSVDRDGSYLGFDTDLINLVCSSVKIPVICLGGAKNSKDFITAFNNTKVSAAAASNFFHFTEHSIITTKSNISKNIPLRLETQASYLDFSFDNDSRILKKDDNILEEMLFTKIEKEVI